MKAGLPGWLAFPSLRALGVFWGVLLAAAAAGGIALELAGPPAPDEARAPAPAEAPPSPETAPAAGAPAVAAASEAAPAAGAPAVAPASEAASPGPDLRTVAAPETHAEPRPGRTMAGPIAPPDPALLEPAADVPGGGLLPRIAADGRAPMAAYARPFDPAVGTPVIGILVAGVGLHRGDTEDAIRTLPEAVTLAVSPYAANLRKLQERIRTSGHELLLSIPMEPQGYPLSDPGRQALLTGASDAKNLRALNWSLARVGGYAGVTGALGVMRGERFAASTGQMAPVIETLAARGLLYVDPRPGAPEPQGIWARGVDVVIDDPPTWAGVGTSLARLEQIARERGSAVGLVGAVRPAIIGRVAGWAKTLPQRGIALAPLSALAQPPRTETGAAR